MDENYYDEDGDGGMVAGDSDRMPRRSLAMYTRVKASSAAAAASTTTIDAGA
jgi:hypothetical protein